MRRVAACCIITVLITLAFTAPAQAGEWQFKDGRWRCDATTVLGTYSGKTDRDHDGYGTVSIGYEFPAYDHLTFELRGYPLFVYAGPDWIYGAGFGIAGRYYQNSENRDGWYAEAGVGPIFHSPQLKDNTSDFNFLVEFGVGYKFPDNNWHTALSWQHMSNASTASKNAGVNAFGFTIGRTF